MMAPLYSLVIVDLLALPSVQRSLVALAIGGVAMPIVGVFIIGLDVITVRFAVMHMALFGTALGLWMGIEPTVVALFACVLTAVMVAPAADSPGGLAGPMSFLMTISAAAALLVLSISGVNANGAFEILWGSILAVRQQDLILIVLVSLIVVVLVMAKRRDLALLLFDREIAKCSGIAVGLLTMCVLAVISLSIGSAIRVTGALLVDSITLLPALAARNLASSMTSMMKWAATLGVVGNVIGFFVALQLDLPPGPVLVLVAGAITLGTGFMKRGMRTPGLQLH